MPISSGANGWPNVYRLFRQQQRPPPTKPQPVPPALPPQPRHVHVVEGPPPSYSRSQSPPRRPTYSRYPYSSHQPPPPYQQPYQQPACGDDCGGCGGPCGRGLCADGGPCGPPSGAEGAGPCCCFCGGSALYTTGVSGANTGCFQGGMFSSKNPAYPMGQSSYVLQNTGRHRCWACLIGTIIGLLLLGLILGCALALDPYLKTQSAIKDFLANNPGARVVGDYILVPRKTYIDYYKVNGAEMPCWPDWGTSVPTTEILPQCDDLTTSIEWTFSVLITAPTTEMTTAAVTRPAAGVVTSVCLLVTGLTQWLVQ